MASQREYLGLRGARLRAAMVLLVVAPSFILFGYCNGSTGGIATLQSFVHQFPSIDTINTTGALKSHNATVKGVVTGSYDLGAVLGSLLCIGYSDRIGRLRTVFIGLLISIVGLVLQAASFNLAQFTVGRIIIGVAIGTISAAVPVWQSECSTSAHRGAFVILEGLCISGGITLSEWVSFGCSFSSNHSVQWRLPLILPVIFSVFVMPFLFVMPESPRWLARKGRLDDARSVLAALEDDTPDCAKVQRAMAEIQQSLSMVTGSLKELTKNGEERVLHRTLLAACGQMFQQMCGISALVFYTGTIFQDLGFKGDKAKLLGASLTTFQTLCSVIPLFLIDKYGRRKLFMITGTGLAICTAVLAGTGSSQSRESSAVNAAVVFIFLFDLFFPMGFLGQTFLYATELAPLRLRVPVTAIANATQWLCQFIVAQITPPGTTNLGSRFWIIFAVLNASFVPIVYFFFPETKGRSLEEIDEIFWLSNGLFDVVKIARTHKSSSAARPEEESDSVERGTETGWKARVHQKEQV